MDASCWSSLSKDMQVCVLHFLEDVDLVRGILLSCRGMAQLLMCESATTSSFWKQRLRGEVAAAAVTATAPAITRPCAFRGCASDCRVDPWYALYAETRFWRWDDDAVAHAVLSNHGRTVTSHAHGSSNRAMSRYALSRRRRRACVLVRSRSPASFNIGLSCTWLWSGHLGTQKQGLAYNTCGYYHYRGTCREIEDFTCLKGRHCVIAWSIDFDRRTLTLEHNGRVVDVREMEPDWWEEGTLHIAYSSCSQGDRVTFLNPVEERLAIQELTYQQGCM